MRDVDIPKHILIISHHCCNKKMSGDLSPDILKNHGIFRKVIKFKKIIYQEYT